MTYTTSEQGSNPSGGLAPASASLGAIGGLLAWQADTDIRLREAILFEPQRLAAEEVLRCVFTRTTVDSDYLQWSRTNNDFALFIDGVENTLWSDNDLRIAGYLRVGSLTAPTNVTDGDLTTTRLLVGTDAAFPTNVVAYANMVAAGLLRVDTGGVQRFQVGASIVQVGVDGSAPELLLTAMDGVDEGGQMALAGAAANQDWRFDNYQGRLRYHDTATSYHEWGTTFFRTAGYVRVGNIGAPTNITAGDITAGRLLIGTDAAFPTNVLAYANMVAAGLVRIDTGSVQRFQIGASAVQVGVDGSAPEFILAAMDGTDEGGQMVIRGSAANQDWVLDNFAGRLRLHDTATTFHDFSTTFLRTAGYARVGSINAPTNTTAGDFTAIRACLGTDTAFNTSGLLELNSTTQALIVSRMTTGQRDLMTAVNGMIIYNTTTATLQGFQGGAWTNL